MSGPSEIQKEFLKSLDRPWGLEVFSSVKMEEAYWKVVSQMSAMQHQYIRAKELEELNQQQAGRITELELYYNCFKRVGGTLIIDYQKLNRLLYTFEGET